MTAQTMYRIIECRAGSKLVTVSRIEKTELDFIVHKTLRSPCIKMLKGRHT